MWQYRTPGGIQAFLDSPKGHAMEEDISRVEEVLEEEAAGQMRSCTLAAAQARGAAISFLCDLPLSPFLFAFGFAQGGRCSHGGAI